MPQNISQNGSKSRMGGAYWGASLAAKRCVSEVDMCVVGYIEIYMNQGAANVFNRSLQRSAFGVQDTSLQS